MRRQPVGSFCTYREVSSSIETSQGSPYHDVVHQLRGRWLVERRVEGELGEDTCVIYDVARTLVVERKDHYNEGIRYSLQGSLAGECTDPHRIHPLRRRWCP